MRVDPEQVLVQERIPALGGVEETDAEQAFDEDQGHGDAQHRRGQKLNPGRCIERPGEERELAPAHLRSTQAMDGGDEIEPRQNGRKAEDEDRDHGQGDVGRGPLAERHVKGPARVRRAAAGEEAGHGQDRSGQVQPPGKEVEAWKGHVLGADLQRQQNVAEGRRDAWDDKKKDHDHAVQGEHGVVGLGVHDGPSRRDEFQAHEHAQHHADGEHAQDGPQVEHADALVIRGEDPGQDAASTRIRIKKGHGFAGRMHAGKPLLQA